MADLLACEWLNHHGRGTQARDAIAGGKPFLEARYAVTSVEATYDAAEPNNAAQDGISSFARWLVIMAVMMDHDQPWMVAGYSNTGYQDQDKGGYGVVLFFRSADS